MLLLYQRHHLFFLAPEIDSKTHLSTGVSIKTIKAALEHSEDIKAFVLTNPTYYGVARRFKGDH